MMLVAVVATVLMSCGGGGGRPTFGDNEYPVDVVATQNASLQSTYPATINGVQDVEIRPKVSGFLTQINVTEGQTVSAGQVLFVIDNETYQAQVRQAQAAVNTAQSAVNTAKLTFDNTKNLHASKVVGDYELQTAENTFLSAQAQLAQAQAALSSAKEALSFCYVKSPAAGVVGTLPLKKGALVSASNVLTHVSDISTMDVYFSMTEKDMLTMSQGEGGLKGAVEKFPPLKLQLADGTMYDEEAKIALIDNKVDPKTNKIMIWAILQNEDHKLLPGSYATVYLSPKSDKPTCAVIVSAVQTEAGGGSFVYVLDGENKVERREVRLGALSEKYYEITSGLKPGETVVIEGVNKVQPGQTVNPIPAEKDEL